jgi:hypothetical protein
MNGESRDFNDIPFFSVPDRREKEIPAVQIGITR